MVNRYINEEFTYGMLLAGKSTPDTYKLKSLPATFLIDRQRHNLTRKLNYLTITSSLSSERNSDAGSPAPLVRFASGL